MPHATDMAFLSIGHPEYSKGGTEVASFSLFKHAQSKLKSCKFIGFKNGRLSDELIRFSENEWVATSQVIDNFMCLGNSYISDLSWKSVLVIMSKYFTFITCRLGR